MWMRSRRTVPTNLCFIKKKKANVSGKKEKVKEISLKPQFLLPSRTAFRSLHLLQTDQTNTHRNRKLQRKGVIHMPFFSSSHHAIFWSTLVFQAWILKLPSWCWKSAGIWKLASLKAINWQPGKPSFTGKEIIRRGEPWVFAPPLEKQQRELPIFSWLKPVQCASSMMEL